MISTADCKTFIVDFFQNNPQVIKGLYGEDFKPEEMQMVVNSKNWKRRYKCKPGNGDYAPYKNQYMIFENGTGVDRFGETNTRRPVTDFVSERGFDCDPFDGGISYMILEDVNGDLHLGNYIGD